LFIKAEQVHDKRDLPLALNVLQHLRADVQLLMKELETHETWEELNVFSAASDYFKLKIRPSITPSIWVLEKEHELVKSNLSNC
jgi:hypothetical protein